MKTNIHFILMLFFCLAACTSKKMDSNNVKDHESVLEKNKQIAAAVFEQFINKRNLSAVDELYATSIVDHSPFEGEVPGIEGFKKTLKEFIDMFPDLKVTLV